MENKIKETEEKQIVFVYGSLKKGFHNHGYLGKSKFIGLDSIKGKMYDFNSFPAITLDGDTEIKGELYEIDFQTSKSLDYLEGYPKAYNKKLMLTNGGTKAFVYFTDDIEKLSKYYNYEVKDYEGGDWQFDNPNMR